MTAPTLYAGIDPGIGGGVMLGNGTRWHIRCLPADVHGEPVLLDDGNELESRAICIRCGQPIALESWARHEYASERRQGTPMPGDGAGPSWGFLVAGGKGRAAGLAAVSATYATHATHRATVRAGPSRNL